jgi:hypothetical protein
MICWVEKMENPREIMNELHIEKDIVYESYILNDICIGSIE